MDEVDNIIIYSLKEIGCDFTDEITKLSEFTVEMVVQAVAKCLNIINEQTHISPTLPPSMSARFRIGSSLASACQDLGYQGEVGYQTFLYANEQDIRNVMMFLIEKLPKDTSDSIDEPLGTSILLSRRIAAELKRQLSTPWAPAYCRRKNVVKVENESFFLGNSSFHKINTYLLQYPVGMSESDKVKQGKVINDPNMDFATSQINDRYDIHASIAEENAYQVAEEREWENEWNRNGIASRLSVEDYKKQKRERLVKRLEEKLMIDSKNDAKGSTGSLALKDLLNSMSGNETRKSGKGSRFTHAEKLQFGQDVEKMEAKITEEQQDIHQGETEEELKQKRDKEMADLRDGLNNLTLKFQDGQYEIKQLINRKEKLDEEKSSIQDSVNELESLYKVKKKTYDLLPDADHNIQKLEQLVENSQKKLVNLNDQWEKHRNPLIEKYEELLEQRNCRTSKVESHAEQVQSLREKMKSAADETKGKEELLKQLIAEFDSMSKDLNRSAYTKRILEIVGNIKKQKDQIAKVLLDTKDLQKDINFLTGKLDRTFIVTEELIFRDAKKDEFSRKAYKLLAGLHESFGSLVRTIEETGVIMREIRDLEDQIDNISEKEIDENLQHIGNDLKQINQENKELMNKIKKKR